MLSAVCACVFVEEVLKGEYEKPHPSIFAKACKLADCTESEAIHVGDSLKTDVQGGINAKVAATIWINAKDKDLTTDEPKPDYIVKVVTEIENLIEQNFNLIK